MNLSNNPTQIKHLMSLKRNVIANYFGNGWTAIMSLVFIPYYIKYLGMEAFGLIGFYTMLQACLIILDLGMTPTLSREMARFTGGKHTPQSIRDLLRSIEIICLVVGSLYLLVIWLSSDWVATNWLQAEKLSKESISGAFIIMGGVTALRFVEGIYRGAIIGLQKQVIFNLANALMATLRGAGAFLILAYIYPSIEAYFIWQGVVSVITVILFVSITYSALPEANRPGSFSRNELHKVWLFAGGVVVTTFLALILTQVDKIILSKILTLADFGNYSLVATISGVLILMVGPIVQAHYPRISELQSQNQIEALKKSFHRAAQLSTSIAGTAACVLFFFGNRIITIWTGDLELGQKVFTLLRVMTLGTFLNSLMQLPHILQLAYGWSGFTAKVNIIAVFFLVPAIIIVTPVYGPIGAAWVWVTLNAGYVFVATHFMFKKILVGEKINWFLGDLFKPFFSTFLILSICWLLKPDFSDQIKEFAYFALSGTGSFFFSLLCSSEIREYLKVRMSSPDKIRQNIS